MRHTYHVEVEMDGQWSSLGWSSTRGYVEGYVTAMGTTPGPRLGYRCVREDGHVTMWIPAKPSVSIGMVAGFPTAEQYERAGQEALERARLIREIDR